MELPIDLDLLDDGQYALLFCGRLVWTGATRPDKVTVEAVRAEVHKLIKEIRPARKQDGQWWIRDPLNKDAHGPYRREADAAEDARGIRNFFLNQHIPGYVTSGK